MIRFLCPRIASAAVFALAVLPAAIIEAQEPAKPPTEPARVLVAGENPAIRYLDKEGGKAVTSVNFWRVEWSPAGAGAICFVSVNDPAGKHLRFAVYDNKEVLDYVTNDVMSLLLQTFNDPPYTPEKGTIKQTNQGATERRELCKSDRHKVELVWKGLGPGTWVNIKPQGKVFMTFTMVPAAGGEIWINGKQAPGTWYPAGGGLGTGAYLTVNETWRR